MCRFSISAECQLDKFYLTDLLGLPKESPHHAHIMHGRILLHLAASDSDISAILILLSALPYFIK
jgi:hypothetical protein